MTKFALRLRELRCSKDLSQQKLADRIKISKSSINMYERGEREPGLEMLEVIADFFNVDLDYLLGKSNIANKTLSLNYISKKYTLLNALGQQKANAYIDDLLENPKYKKSNISSLSSGEIAAYGADGTEGTIKPHPEDIT